MAPLSDIADDKVWCLIGGTSEESKLCFNLDSDSVPHFQNQKQFKVLPPCIFLVVAMFCCPGPLELHSVLLCAHQPCVWQYFCGSWGHPRPPRPPSCLSRWWWLLSMLLCFFPPPLSFPPPLRQSLEPPPL